MTIFLFSLPVLAITGIFYFIVSGKSDPAVRRAAVIAFALALLSILVCSVFILSRPAAMVAGSNYSPDSEIPVTPVSPLNFALVIGMSLVFLLFVIFIVVAARRERRRKNG